MISKRYKPSHIMIHGCLLVLTFISGQLSASAASPAKEQNMITVIPSDELQIFAGPEQWFTGTTKVEMLFGEQDVTRASGAAVTFEPKARTAWHTHPRGQTLIVTAGVGYVQMEGHPRQQFKQGDVVWIPAHVKHWHGAAEDQSMTHIAIQESEEGSAVEWLEQVSDHDYQG